LLLTGVQNTWASPSNLDRSQNLGSNLLAKYQQRADTWSRLNLGLHFNTVVCKPFAASVLGFVWQLDADVPELLETFEKVLRN